MSLGTVYLYPALRAYAPRAVIKKLNLDVKVVNIREVDSPEYYAKFPLKKIPTFVGANGFELTEVMAIVYYLADLSPTPHTLLGTTKEDRASVMKWFSYANTDFWIALRDAMFPLIGRLPYNKEAVAAALQNTHSYVAVVEAHLQSRPHQHPYLVGDSATVADYMLVACLERGFQNIWGKDFIASHPAIHRYFENMLSQEPLNDLYPVPYPHRDEPLPNEPPQKA